MWPAVRRNVTDCETGAFRHKRFLILDRESAFSPRFKAIVGGSGVGILMTAYQAPNMNAHAERFVRSIRSECLDQMIFVGPASLEGAIEASGRLGGLLKYYYRRAA